MNWDKPFEHFANSLPKTIKIELCRTNGKSLGSTILQTQQFLYKENLKKLIMLKDAED